MFTRQKSQIDIKKSTQKLLDSKKEIGARIKHLKLILDTVDVDEAKSIFATHYSHIYHLVYEGIVSSETKMRGPAHQKQRDREELESVLQILEKIMLLLPDLLQCRWQLHSLSRLFGRLSHPHNSIRLRREAIRLFTLWYTALNTSAPKSVDEMFTEIVKNQLPEKYQEQVISPLEIQGINQEKYSNDSESVEYLLECLLDFMVTESSRHSWNHPLAFNSFHFLYEKFKTFYLDKLFPDFQITYDLYSELPIELPDLRPMSVEKTDQSKISCQVVFIKWIANYTHSVYKTWNATNQKQNLNFDKSGVNNKEVDENVRAKNVILGTRANINLVHEVFRRALLMNFVQSAVIRRVICVYKDWIQMNVPELPIFMLEPDGSPEDLKAGSQKILRLFFVNSSSVFLLFGIPSDALLEEQVDICKRVLNIYRYAVMNTRMDSETWEQLLVVMLNVTSKVLNPKANNILGSKLSSALFQTLIVSWVKASLNVRIPLHLWDELQSVLALLTFSDNLVTEWAKTMETLTRVLSRHVYNLDLSNLPLDRLTEQKAKKNRGKKQSHGGGEGIAVSQSDDTSSIQVKKEPRSKPLKKMKRSLSEGNLNLQQTVKDERHPQSSLKRTRSADIEMYNSSTDISSIVSLETNHHNLIDTSLPDQGITSEVEGDHLEGKDQGQQAGSGVIEGGHVKGWLPSVASILWRRMLGILGDVNLIPYPQTHLHFFQVLTDIWNTLIKIRRNLGVSIDNLSTPKPPELTPPLQLISPWCFQVVDLPREYNASKLLAISLLCDITLEDTPLLGQDYMSKFYGMVHRIITSGGQDLKNELVKRMGQKWMGKMLPGFTLLLSDLVQCSLSILSTPDLGKTPRMDAATLLANILFVSKVTVDLPVLNPDQTKFQPVSSQQQQTQEMSLLNLMKCSKLEPTSHARAITLQALTIYACGLLEQMRLSQANNNNGNSDASASIKFSDGQKNLLEAIVHGLVASVNVDNRNICLVCSDLLLCLSEYAYEIKTHLNDLESEIILGLKTSIVNTLENTGGGGRPFEKRLLLSLILTLGEWCMSIPVQAISHDKCSEYKLLSSVFDALLLVIKGRTSSGSGSAASAGLNRSYAPRVNEFNPSVPFDDLQQLDPSGSSVGGKSSMGKESVFMRPESKSEQRSSLKRDVDIVQLAATNLLYHLETQLGHFPINVSSRCSSIVSENHDSIYEADELNSIIFTLPNLQMFALDNNRILTVIELDNEDNLDSCYVRFIIRDLSGKSCWDVSTLEVLNAAPVPLQPHWQAYNITVPEDNNLTTSSFNPLANGPRLTLRKRPLGTLPMELDSAHDLDNLDDLLSYIKYTSPECSVSDRDGGTGVEDVVHSEEDVVSVLVSQRNTELQHLNSAVFPTLSQTHEESSHKNLDHNNTFRNSRKLLSQVGFNAWDKRGTIHLLDKDDKLLRELKHLDMQRCREAHKIAMIYVARGQEDKHSILANTGGSEDYEDFVSGLGWEVELESHTGFMGGLLRNKSSGETAPYFATSFTEVIFHVSTRMPADNQDDLLQKTRHLGNDEVHIVWSEHNRDYRRDIIPTEFCDVLIVIYPLQFGLYRVTINRKSEVPYFGPLYHESIVEKPILAHLVRCTAVNASRAKRSSLPYFQHYFEERQKSLETIMTNHRIRSTFETFTSSLYRPLNPCPLEFQSGCCSRASATSFTSTNTNKTINSQQLAALIDSNLHHHNPNLAHLHSQYTHQHSHPHYHVESPTVSHESTSVPPSPTPPVPPKRLSIKLGHGLKPKMQTPPVSPSTMRR